MIPQGDSSEKERPSAAGRAAARALGDAASVLDALQSAVIVITRDGTIRFANRAVMRVAQVRPADCIGRPLASAIPPLACVCTGDRHIANGADPSRRPRVDLVGEEGPGCFEVVATPYGESICIELRPVADPAMQAQAAAEARNAFLTTVSHELRTPLTALTGFGELLADQIPGPLNDQQCDMVGRMCSATHNLSMMIEEILTYSSLEAGQEIVRATPSCPSAILSAAAGEIAPQAAIKGLALELDIPRDLAPIHTDPQKVRQILVHLASNAVKFTERGTVRMAVARRKASLRFTVRDTGIGIDPASQHRLFQPFEPLDAGLTRRHGGTGLGLHISDRLARLLGGRIEVSSEAGAGSAFTLELPDRQAAGPTEA